LTTTQIRANCRQLPSPQPFSPPRDLWVESGCFSRSLPSNAWWQTRPGCKPCQGRQPPDAGAAGPPLGARHGPWIGGESPLRSELVATASRDAQNPTETGAVLGTGAAVQSVSLPWKICMGPWGSPVARAPGVPSGRPCFEKTSAGGNDDQPKPMQKSDLFVVALKSVKVGGAKGEMEWKVRVTVT
jgi:hypothetical protein